MKNKGRIFLIDDDELIVNMLSRSLKKEGYSVQTATTTDGIMDRIESSYPDIVLLDINLPGLSGIEILEKIREGGIQTQVLMLTADDTAETAIRAMKLGAADYLTKPFNMEEVKIVLAKIIEQERLQDEVNYLRRVRSQTLTLEIIGESGAMRDIKERAEKLAEARVQTVLITGESGTGKELMARFIHRTMFRSHGAQCVPFIAVNCTALPHHLIESELFGFVKGAFTDAKSDRKGMFELASGGSILLDEIGDMDPNLQSKLLRVIEDRSIWRVGGKAPIPIDVTMIATTNRNIQDALEDGGFRKDLFYRLSTFSLHVPPLRERREDIPLLSQHFLTLFAGLYNKKLIKDFSPEAHSLLRSYDWPGNVRELKNVVERVVVLESAEVIEPAHLPIAIRNGESPRKAQPAGSFILPKEGISMDDLEKNLIAQALTQAKNNKAHAAKLLDMTYDTLRYKVKKYELE
jgi:DNA-binding NtrC family response regulator